MLNDDGVVGRVLTRREVLALFGATGAAMMWPHPEMAAGQAPPCVVVPEQMEGPYFVDERLNRADIRPDPAGGVVPTGTPLTLSMNISQIGAGGACAPLVGAIVDLWQCDAVGVYSDVRDTRLGFDTRGKKFLRGYQVTDTSGVVQFTTIYPGWYPGRTVHVHFKIRTSPSAPRGQQFTSQLYFDDALTDRVHNAAPYNTKGPRKTTNSNDGIYRTGGRQLMVHVTEQPQGLTGQFQLGVKI